MIVQMGKRVQYYPTHPSSLLLIPGWRRFDRPDYFIAVRLHFKWGGRSCISKIMRG